MRKLLLAAVAFLALIPAARAADSTVSAMSAASALGGTELLYCVQGGADRKCTADQLKTWASASPTLVTPILGVATATSIAIAGCTIGADELCVTGTTALQGTTATTLTLSGALTYGGVTLTAAVTGTGAMVLATTPTLVTPVLGVATATSINKVAITAPATSATLTLIDGTTLTGPAASGTAMTLGNAETVTGVKTFTAAAPQLILGVNTTTLGSIKLFGSTSGDVTVKAAAVAGTATVFQLPPTNGSNTNVLQTDGNGVTSWVAAGGGSGITIDTTTITGGTTTRLLYDNAGTVGEVSGWTSNGSTALTGGASTTLAVAGATIGSFSFAAGTASIDSTLTLPGNAGNPKLQFVNSSTQFEYFGGAELTLNKSLLLGSTNLFVMTNGTITGTIDLLWGRNAAATFRHGAADAASPVAQTLTVQSVSAGTADTAGAAWTIGGSKGTGTGTGGAINLQIAPAGSTGSSQNALATALGISGEGLITVPLITTDATHTTSTVCQDTTTHALYFGSGTVGICLGTSSARYKTKIAALNPGLPELAKLEPKTFFYKSGHGDGGAKQQVGFLAEDMVKVLPQLVGLDNQSKPNSVDLVGLIPIIVHAIKELKADNDNLRRMLPKKRAAN